MDHRDHVRLIRPGVEPAGRRWLELGAGEGAFTLALADILAPAGRITALDRDADSLHRLREGVRRAFPGVDLETVAGDFRTALPDGPFDGVVAANSLHFVGDPVPVLQSARAVLRPGGHLVVVEYDADDGNRWVPHPFSSRRFEAIAAAAGFVDAREIGRVSSRFLGAIYSALAVVPPNTATAPRETPVLHSRLHGEDRDESARSGHEASAGRCEPRGTTGTEVTREPCGQASDSAPRGDPEPAPAMSGQAPDREPAGGTTTPFVRWTSGAFDFSGAAR